MFGAQHLKAKALGFPSLREMHGHSVHLLTCSELPHGWVDAVGGMVAARSVRLDIALNMVQLSLTQVQACLR